MRKLVCVSCVFLLFSALHITDAISGPKETVQVKYRGSVDLTPFKCEAIPQSSLVKRLCYDQKEQYLIVKLKDSYYHYCEVPENVIKVWVGSDSLGKYYNVNVKGRFDCRVLRVPEY